MPKRVAYVKSGRVRQKSRTQAALVEAARALMAEGITPTVDDAAARADVSRATAYRYFPNQRELLISSFPIIATPSLLPGERPQDALDGIRLVVRAILDSIIENETALRAHLRISLETTSPPVELPLRKGRRITWFEDALEPLRKDLGQQAFHRLTLGLAACVSLEVLIWLVDVAGLSREQAIEQIVWTAEQLVQSAGQLARNPSRSPQRRRRA